MATKPKVIATLTSDRVSFRVDMDGMTDLTKAETITVADGKYIISNNNGALTVLRNGEPWNRDLSGDNLVYWMFVEIQQLRAALAAQQAAQPVAWGQLGMLNGKTYLRMNYDRTPYPPPADVVRNLNLVPLFAAAQPQQAEQTVWRGAARCDMCKKVITRNLYDAATRHGPWATMCASCFSFHGLGVGTGRGQHYKQQPDGLFVKIAG